LPKTKKNLREFLATTFPALADAPIVYSRVCCIAIRTMAIFGSHAIQSARAWYIAAGDCGHGFKFRRCLDEIIADSDGKKTESRSAEICTGEPEVQPGTRVDVARANAIRTELEREKFGLSRRCD